jgi:hypothetical protein
MTTTENVRPGDICRAGRRVGRITETFWATGRAELVADDGSKFEYSIGGLAILDQA